MFDAHWIMPGFLLLIGLIVVRGDLALRGRKKLEARMRREYAGLEILGDAVCHGGIPAMPKPEMLTVGVTASSVCLFNKQGASVCVSFADIQAIERFSTRKAPGRPEKEQVVIRFGLMMHAGKTRLRNFIVIRYTDAQREENNILLEIKQKEHHETYFAVVRFRHEAYGAAEVRAL